MLTLYWLFFVLGGVFVLLAIIGGFDGVDFDGLDGDAALETDLDIAAPGVRSRDRLSREDVETQGSVLEIVFSLKFWTFGLCFFGLTGLVLSNLSVTLPPSLIVIAALLMGILCGAIVSGMLRILRNQHANSLVRSDDVVGLEGVVTLPFDHDSRGKVQIKVKGSQVERIAYTDEQNGFQLGDPILVVGVDQERLWVVSARHIDASDEP